ncbi:MAG: pilus assembly protein PilP [Myxococcales bacterium]|nr:pilus assembly protein PilP [Myxococcales bacterium]
MNTIHVSLMVTAIGSFRCGGDNLSSTPSPKPNTPAESKLNAAQANPPITAVALSDDEVAYVYSPIGKRDPFRSIYDEFQQDTENEQLTELQKFELDQLKLVAIVSRIATPYAMVEDPDGKGHTLTRGKLIGKNWGRVSQITPDCVVIKEEYRDYTGRRVTNQTNMCIPKPSELGLE